MWGSAQSDWGVCFFSRIFHELFNVLLCGRLYGVVRCGVVNFVRLVVVVVVGWYNIPY